MGEGINARGVPIWGMGGVEAADPGRAVGYINGTAYGHGSTRATVRTLQVTLIGGVDLLLLAIPLRANQARTLDNSQSRPGVRQRG